MSFSANAQSTAKSPPPAITTRLPRRSSRRRTSSCTAAGGLEPGQSVKRRTVGPERAATGRDDHRPGAHRVALISGQNERAGSAGQTHHPAPEQTRRPERRDLAFQLRHQFARVDRRMRGDVEDRFFRIERGALASHFGQGVDQHAGQLQHAQLEHREQAHRAGSDDRNIGVDFACHTRHVLSETRVVRDSAAAADCIDVRRRCDPLDGAAEPCGYRNACHIRGRPDPVGRCDPAGGRIWVPARPRSRALSCVPRPAIPRWRCRARHSPWCRATTRRSGVVHHFDLWRLEGPCGLVELGWDDACDGHSAGRMAGPARTAASGRGVDCGVAPDRRGQPPRRPVGLARSARPHRMSRDGVIAAFLASHGYGSARAEPLAQDASFRRYLRLTGGPRPAILMDAPPPEDIRPFVRVARPSGRDRRVRARYHSPPTRPRAC